MSFDWSKYWDVADYLYKNPASNFKDASYRTAISRAYYAAYWIARLYIEKFGISISGERNAHTAVINKFLETTIIVETNSQTRRIGNNLNKLRDNRRYADYESEINQNLKSTLEYSLGLSKTIINVIKPLL